jgi:hypothetical protein
VVELLSSHITNGSSFFQSAEQKRIEKFISALGEQVNLDTFCSPVLKVFCFVKNWIGECVDEVLDLCELCAYLPQYHSRIIRLITLSRLFSSRIVDILITITRTKSKLDAAFGDVWKTACINDHPVETLVHILRVNVDLPVLNFVSSLYNDIEFIVLTKLGDLPSLLHSRALLHILNRTSNNHGLILTLIDSLSSLPAEMYPTIASRLESLPLDQPARNSFLTSLLFLLRWARSSHERDLFLQLFLSYISLDSESLFEGDKRPLSIFGPLIRILAKFPDSEFSHSVSVLFNIALTINFSRSVLRPLALLGCLIIQMELPQLSHSFLDFLFKIRTEIPHLNIWSQLILLALHADAFLIAVQELVFPVLPVDVKLDPGANFWAAVLQKKPAGKVEETVVCCALFRGGDIARARLISAIRDGRIPVSVMAAIHRFAIQSVRVKVEIAEQFIEAIESVCTSRDSFERLVVVEVPVLTRKGIRKLFEGSIV